MKGMATIKEKTLFEEYITKQRGTLLIKVKGMERRRKNIMMNNNSSDYNSDNNSGDNNKHATQGVGKSKYGPLNERRTAMYKSSLSKSELCRIVRTSSVLLKTKNLENNREAAEDSILSSRNSNNENNNVKEIDKDKNKYDHQQDINDDNNNDNDNDNNNNYNNNNNHNNNNDNDNNNTAYAI